MTEFYLHMESAFPLMAKKSGIANVLFELDKKEKATILESSNLAYKDIQPLSTSYAFHAIQNIITNIKEPIDYSKSGIFTTSGFQNVQLSCKYLYDIGTRGQPFASPLKFPYTIANSMPTSLARHFNFKSFAISLGHDPLAYFDCIYRSIQMLKASRCAQVFSVATNERSELAVHVSRSLEYKNLLKDVGLAGLVTKDKKVSNASVLVVDLGYYNEYEGDTKKKDLINTYDINIENVICVTLNKGCIIKKSSNFICEDGEVMRSVASVAVWNSYYILNNLKNSNSHLIIVEQLDGRSGYIILKK